MTIKLAVILAAGMGTRLKELGISRPLLSNQSPNSLTLELNEL